MSPPTVADSSTTSSRCSGRCRGPGLGSSTGRGSGSGRPAASTLDIRPLTPERLPDLASLFEEGGDPKWCWCAYFRIRGFDFSKGSKERHRAAMEAATYATAEG